MSISKRALGISLGVGAAVIVFGGAVIGSISLYSSVVEHARANIEKFVNEIAETSPHDRITIEINEPEKGILTHNMQLVAKSDDFAFTTPVVGHVGLFNYDFDIKLDETTMNGERVLDMYNQTTLNDITSANLVANISAISKKVKLNGVVKITNDVLPIYVDHGNLSNIVEEAKKAGIIDINGAATEIPDEEGIKAIKVYNSNLDKDMLIGFCGMIALMREEAGLPYNKDYISGESFKSKTIPEMYKMAQDELVASVKDINDFTAKIGLTPEATVTVNAEVDTDNHFVTNLTLDNALMDGKYFQNIVVNNDSVGYPDITKFNNANIEIGKLYEFDHLKPIPKLENGSINLTGSEPDAKGVFNIDYTIKADRAPNISNVSLNGTLSNLNAEYLALIAKGSEDPDNLVLGLAKTFNLNPKLTINDSSSFTYNGYKVGEAKAEPVEVPVSVSGEGSVSLSDDIVSDFEKNKRRLNAFALLDIITRSNQELKLHAQTDVDVSELYNPPNVDLLILKDYIKINDDKSSSIDYVYKQVDRKVTSELNGEPYRFRPF